MPRARGTRDIATRLAAAEDQLRRLKLGSYGEGSGSGGGADFSSLGWASRISNAMPLTDHIVDVTNGDYLNLESIWFDTSAGDTMTDLAVNPGKLFAPSDAVYRASGRALGSGMTSEPSQMWITITHVHPPTGGPGLITNYRLYGDSIPFSGGFWSGESHGSVSIAMKAGDWVQLFAAFSSSSGSITGWSISSHDAWLELEQIGIET